MIHYDSLWILWNIWASSRLQEFSCDFQGTSWSESHSVETNDLREARTTALNSDRTKLPAHQVVPLQIWYKYVPCIAHAVLSQHHCLGILIAPTPRRHLGSSVEQSISNVNSPLLRQILHVFHGFPSLLWIIMVIPALFPFTHSHCMICTDLRAAPPPEFKQAAFLLQAVWVGNV